MKAGTAGLKAGAGGPTRGEADIHSGGNPEQIARRRPGGAPDRSALEFLIQAMDQAFDKKSWHGTNLRGSVRGLTVNQAVWRPSPKRHNIAEQVLHSAYWKYVVRRRLKNEKRGSFPLKGSNWIAVGPSLGESDWRDELKLLDETHSSLRAAVLDLSPNELDFKPPGSKVSNFMLISGIAAHDVYHAGQIQLLKALGRQSAR